MSTARIEQFSKLILSRSSDIEKLQIEAFKGIQSSQNTLIDAVVHILSQNPSFNIANNPKDEVSKMSNKLRQQIVFQRINQMVLSAEPRFIGKINQTIFKLICQLSKSSSSKNKILFSESQALQNYVLLWSRIFNGSQQKSDYPNVQQTFSKLIKQNNIRQYKELPIAFKNSIWTFQKVLAQRLSKKVQFFDDVDQQFSLISEDAEGEGSAADQIVYMDASQIKQIRLKVQQGGPISRQIASQFLIKAKNFLQVQRNRKMKKQFQDKGAISIAFDYNDEVKWATHFIEKHENYIDGNEKEKYPEKVNFIIQRNKDYGQSRKIQEDFYDESLSDNQSKRFQITVQRDTFYSQKNKNPFSKQSQPSLIKKPKKQTTQNVINSKNATSPDFKGNVLQNRQNQRFQVAKQNQGRKEQVNIQIGNNDEQMIKSNRYNHNQAMSRKTKQGFASTPKKYKVQAKNRVEAQFEYKRQVQQKNGNSFKKKNSFQQRWFRKNEQEIINVSNYTYDPENHYKLPQIQFSKKTYNNDANFIIDDNSKNQLTKVKPDEVFEQQIFVKKESVNSSPRQKRYQNKIIDQQQLPRHYSQPSDKGRGPEQFSQRDEQFEHFDDMDLVIVKHKPEQLQSNNLTPIKQIKGSTQQLFSKSRSFYNTSPGKYGGSNSKKLSQFSQQKKTRKHFAPVHQISQAEEYVVKPYFSHFSDLQNLQRFRRNCFEENLTLYSSSSLLIIASFRQQASNGMKVEIQYRNQSNFNLNISSVYKIPRCFQIEKKSKIHKKFNLTQRNVTHVFNLKLRSFPLDPCLLSLQYGNHKGSEVQIPIPITIRNFLQGIFVTQDQWIGLWEQHSLSYERNQLNTFRICKHTVVDRNIIDIDQLSTVLRQVIQLGPIEGYSVKQFGAFYQYPSLNDQFYQQTRNLSFLIRFSLRVDNIVSLELISMRRVSSAEKDLLLYYINSLIMLLTKIDV